MVPGQALHLGRRLRMKDSCQYTILAQGSSVVVAILLNHEYLPLQCAITGCQ